jgi:hypothetical protein
LSVAVRSVLVGLGIELSDAVEGGTTGCFGGVKLASVGFSFAVVVFVIVVVVVMVVAVVALLGGNWKAFWELKVEV